MTPTHTPPPTGGGATGTFGCRFHPDPSTTRQRQTVLYDSFDDPDRPDLDAYMAIAAEVGARRVVDVARGKQGADLVSWVQGDATHLVALDLSADLALMTGNVAQVFVSDVDWSDTLTAVHAALRPGGWFAFETRRPEVRDWQNWDLAPTPVSLPDGRGAVVTRTVTAMTLPLVTFEGSTTIDGEVMSSASTLRFRERAEIDRDLRDHGFDVADVRDAPDRPGKEYVFLAERR